MIFKVTRNEFYDFAGQSYASMYPNLHRYPATMLPQIGVEVLKELAITSGKLLDPYCGSGSSFVAGLNAGVTEMHGYDINPLAILITKAKFTRLSPSHFRDTILWLKQIIEGSEDNDITDLDTPAITNAAYWFSKSVIHRLSLLKKAIDSVKSDSERQFLKVPFSETVRECSYTRNNEFKLYRIDKEQLDSFNPAVFDIFYKRLEQSLDTYERFYLPLLNDSIVNVNCKIFQTQPDSYDVVLTSPPYGDSRTTVAYGQYSTLSNEWLGYNDARQVDRKLMGGKIAKELFSSGVIADAVSSVSEKSTKRAMEISAFYFDLQHSIKCVSNSVKTGGFVIYVVGNRTVKGVQLPTDQFIAEQFVINGFSHCFTYERALSNKVMPSRNSPSNLTGILQNTMTSEYIVVCQKNRV